MSDSGPPMAGWLSKSNSRLSMFAICVRRLPSASRRMTWAFICPMRMATASTRRCSSALSSLISACCSARVAVHEATPRGGALLSPILNPRLNAVARMATSTAAKAATANGMGEVEVPGTTFTAREKDDVHRASSRPWEQFGSLRPCSLWFKDLYLAGNLEHRETIRPSRRETMPKRPLRNKQTVRPGGKPKTAGDLISARLPALAQRALSAPEASVWHVAVMKALGTELANKVNRCTPG